MAPVTRRRVAAKPTACQPIRKNVMVELKLVHNQACMLCGRKEISEKLYGLLYQLDDVVVHYFCILLSSMAVQNGTDNQGIWGFLLKDIKAELARGTKEICFYCNKKGATISCSGKKCRKVFHLPCGLKNGSMHQYFQAFKSFCFNHRVTQTVNSSALKKSTAQCAICKDAVIPSPTPTSIWAPCCKRDAWFHRDCIQDLALNAGYFFKCPLCNDVDIFKCRMLTLGIYIPSRDASWETVPNAFAELTERHIECSIQTCLCPHEEKRKFQLPSGSWEILPCNSCGSNGTHRLCSSIKREQEWCCPVCKEVSDKDASKKKKLKLEPLDNGNCSRSNEEQVPSHSGEVSQRRHSDIGDPILISDSDDNSDSNSVQVISDDDEQPNAHIVDEPNINAVQQPTIQVEQTSSLIQLPKIHGYGSLITGFVKNFVGTTFTFFEDPNSIDLTLDDDDD
ncbi:PHD finger protein 7 isoform X2 [Acyrthosiphon pisum]|uniref:G2/M phase-specific E3 ubiquitin-protein ligase n=1 Tax=Acyrthosiphon pisum TaxID=7029 RepID=A0A8R2AAS5_ACYPI|nr:PHD finger protein 7 isoform X2 [Acyrthosiphon pisum]|eukprot:XP_003241382.1 PREDICTED: PHD finger protein 7 isoform X2 [Acyrthosiphon pisum]